MIEYLSSDTVEQSAVIYKNKADGNVLNIPANATLQAFITDARRNRIIVPAVTILNTDDGNDWANGVINFKFSQDKMSALASRDGENVIVIVRLTINSEIRSFKQTVKAIKIPFNIV